MMDTAQIIQDLYDRLRHRYGPQRWWPADSPFEVIVGAILTQSVSWTGVERALGNLKEAGLLSPVGLRDVPIYELAALIRPTGYFNVKARRLKALVYHLWERHDGSLERLFGQSAAALRRELLTVHGIGEETADDIILYAAGKPSFVIDAYTRRILDRVAPGHGAKGYGDYQRLFEDALPRRSATFNECHALLVTHAKQSCRKSPRCEGCCLLAVCQTGQYKTAGG